MRSIGTLALHIASEYLRDWINRLSDKESPSCCSSFISNDKGVSPSNYIESLAFNLSRISQMPESTSNEKSVKDTVFKTFFESTATALSKRYDLNGLDDLKKNLKPLEYDAFIARRLKRRLIK